MHYLIIGNSIASVGCIEAIRKVDATSSITVVGDEPFACYARPLISYLLEGRTDVQRMVYRNDAFYEANRVTVMTGKQVVSLDAKAKQVVLENGQTIAYDKVLVATGSNPFIPPMKNLENVKHRFTFMKLQDALALDAVITETSRVLILGAGLIGLKCAEGILRKVKSITVVDLANRILPSILDEQGSAMVQKHMEKEGVNFSLGDSVREFANNEALLTSGKVLAFDVLVVAVGVRPNVSLVRDAGGEINRGILIDQSCKTSLEDVYAAGDCTEGWDMVSGQRKILALLPNAYMQGETAGTSMAGREVTFDKAIAMNAIGFFGMHVITAGNYEGEDKVYATEEGYKRLFVMHGRLAGYILIGDTVSRAGIYTSLIRNQTDLGTIDFDLISEEPMLMAFEKPVRQEKLGGRQ